MVDAGHTTIGTAISRESKTMVNVVVITRIGPIPRTPPASREVQEAQAARRL